ncbi:MAG: hypothetical protein P4L98_21580 [Ancalomicrobiaceae bacterium]|nr:hypothetical protein [Ancalomicrobiaceae bacterium]
MQMHRREKTESKFEKFVLLHFDFNLPRGPAFIVLVCAGTMDRRVNGRLTEFAIDLHGEFGLLPFERVARRHRARPFVALMVRVLFVVAPDH